MQEQSSSPSPWLTTLEAASYLGVAVGTLRNWVSARYVPFARRGRVVRFHREKLDLWLRRGECHGRAEITDLHKSGNRDISSRESSSLLTSKN